jgi:hypothetical protein
MDRARRDSGDRPEKGESSEQPEKAEPGESFEDAEARERRAWAELLEADAADVEPPIDWGDEPEPQDEPERMYRGGRFCDLPTEPGIERHHLVAAASLKAAGLEPDFGLAIQMDRADHKETASYGSYPRAEAYRDEQTKLLLAGRAAEALAIDILDLQVKFGTKYLLATEEAIDGADR